MAFEFPLRVYWEDTDASGVVFYANYLKFFERGRTEWLRSLGIAQQSLREQTGGIFVVTSAQLEYLRQARLDDQLRVTATLKSAGRASLEPLLPRCARQCRTHTGTGWRARRPSMPPVWSP